MNYNCCSPLLLCADIWVICGNSYLFVYISNVVWWRAKQNTKVQKTLWIFVVKKSPVRTNHTQTDSGKTWPVCWNVKERCMTVYPRRIIRLTCSGSAGDSGLLYEQLVAYRRSMKGWSVRYSVDIDRRDGCSCYIGLIPIPNIVYHRVAQFHVHKRIHYPRTNAWLWISVLFPPAHMLEEKTGYYQQTKTYFDPLNSESSESEKVIFYKQMFSCKIIF